MRSGLRQQRFHSLSQAAAANVDGGHDWGREFW